MNTILMIICYNGGMNLEEARDAIGAGVVYKNDFDPPEDGVITGVSRTSVFVRYRGDQNAKATRPSDLVFLSPR